MRPLTLLVAFTLPTWLFAAPVPKALKKQDDMTLLEGRWERVSLDSGRGQEATDDHWIEVKGGGLSRGKKSDQAYLFASVTLRPAESPGHLDMAWDGTMRLRYIYRIDGDTLTLCHGQSDQPRPTEFKGGDGQYCSVWKRVKE